MIKMRDIIREGNDTLRAEAKQVQFPLSAEDQKLAVDMMDYLENSQDPELAKKYGLRAGVGLAAPQVDVSKQMAAVLVPGEDENAEPVFKDVIINPVIISHSIQPGALTEGEGCLSVDRDVPGYVIRHDRITLRYYNTAGEQKKIRLKNYPAIVCQHEIDHLHGILFYDHINADNPFTADDDLVLLS
ncbi:peptide deformylase [Lactiplantibacillus mudanjiangensis]|uniref:Peptide deformylase n=1 Tax=Lactiplantibacillus mudanjiangensis TaxID=1296538 RepID=A0A660E3W4_9LACO|nr:peptide deformylase [Lactiplantibacillus mudanjiangensis]VDG20740.1 Peptide deformylase [Lactobacillus plantarum ZJ316] [Lactiplantibacillus mudanjiangensis]VDG23868.1 Peptide deformylase [Lactobacillus plantarum ZJ316] [Lactiplantibacillus mudanjiangensis]VDG30095.1 Peptide deformylase [Lactobacillus plantarum ZJ316] [Lactiplantibacillus mudanjiangensis]VDG30582.1 Peptide deformylase [Lactobacillus plantarum ZJ316] [Lactiplantibacillus mudanjiangensis]